MPVGLKVRRVQGERLKKLPAAHISIGGEFRADIISTIQIACEAL